jgi:hypothetical protein
MGIEASGHLGHWDFGDYEFLNQNVHTTSTSALANLCDELIVRRARVKLPCGELVRGNDARCRESSPWSLSTNTSNVLHQTSSTPGQAHKLAHSVLLLRKFNHCSKLIGLTSGPDSLSCC